MKKTLSTTLVGAALLIALPASAQAAFVEVTYSGTVSNGFDTTGVFGVPGVSLTGDAFTVTYVFDTTLGTAVSTATQNSVTGGAALGTTSPALLALVQINGQYVPLTGNNFGRILGSNDGTFSEQYHKADLLYDTGTQTFRADVINEVLDFGAALPATITGPLSYTVGLNDDSSGSFSVSVTNDQTGAVISSAYASFVNATLTIKTLSFLPATVLQQLSQWKR